MDNKFSPGDYYQYNKNKTFLKLREKEEKTILCPEN